MSDALALLDRDELIARVHALELANGRLQDDLDALRAEKLGTEFVAPIEWGLTPKETQVLAVLMRNATCTKRAIMAALYDLGADDPPEIKIVDVFVCKVRKKIEPRGVLIETIWGQGWFIPAASKARARELIAASPTAVAA